MSTSTDLGDCQGASGDAHIGTGDEVSGLYYPCDESTSVGIKQGWVRWVANAMQLIGYYLLLNDGFTIGLFIKGTSDLLIMYWALRNKLWDVVGTTAIFTALNFQKFAECFFL